MMRALWALSPLLYFNNSVNVGFAWNRTLCMYYVGILSAVLNQT